MWIELMTLMTFVVMFLFSEWILFFFIFILMTIFSMKNFFLDFKIINDFFLLNPFSYSMVFLSFLILIICFTPAMMMKNKFLTLNLLSLLFFLFMFFQTTNFLFFFFFFEMSVIPIFFMVLGSGYQPERLQAGTYMFFFTLFGSLPYLMFIYFMTSTLKINQISFFFQIDLSFLGMFMFLFTNLAFLIKLPVYFFHSWLPKAHVEASMEGSMILAGVLLKMGGYGLVLMMIWFSKMLTMTSPWIMGYGLMSALIISLMTLSQKDGKKIIAFSSIAHMMMIFSGLMSNKESGLDGGILLMFGHGIISPGMFYLFFLISNYNGSRNLLLIKGFSSLSYTLKLIWFSTLMINMSCPPFFNLMAEILIVTSLISSIKFSFLLMLFSFLFVSIYSLMMFYPSQGNSKSEGSTSLMNISNYFCIFIMMIMSFLPLFLIEKLVN